METHRKSFCTMETERSLWIEAQLIVSNEQGDICPISLRDLIGLPNVFIFLGHGENKINLQVNDGFAEP